MELSWVGAIMTVLGFIGLLILVSVIGAAVLFFAWLAYSTANPGKTPEDFLRALSEASSHANSGGLP